MATTLNIINSRVGEGGQKHGTEVRRVLQLLQRAEFLHAGPSLTSWSSAASAASGKFYESIGRMAQSYIDVDDDDGAALLALCKAAGVVLEIDSDSSGANGFLAFWNAAVARQVPYCWEGAGGAESRVAYGLEGEYDYIVFTRPGASAEFDPHPNKSALGMNCISFTNLALSIWRSGCVHDKPYDASQAAGGFKPVSDRYGLPHIKRPDNSVLDSIYNLDLATDNQGKPDSSFRKTSPYKVHPKVKAGADSPAAKIAQYYFYDYLDVLKVTQPGKLYYVQWCYTKDKTVKSGAVLPSGFGHHDTVLYNGNIYESNVGTPSNALRCTPLGDRMDRSADNALRIYGPV
jgi:hypothetical protein